MNIGLARGFTSRMEYKKLIYKKDMIPVMQRNMKKYLFFRDWTWYFLVNGTKRFIGQVDMEAEIQALEEEAAVACKANDEVNNSPYILNTEGYNWIQYWTLGVVFRGD